MAVLPWATILYNLEYLHWLIEDILGRHRKSPMVSVRFLHVVEGQVEDCDIDISMFTAEGVSRLFFKFLRRIRYVV